MSFLHPAILVSGLLAIAIPILIHLLLRRRRQPVPWAAMRFLLEAYRKRRRKLTLEQMLLLITRCLIVALLGAAIAAPVLGGAASGTSGRLLVVVIDDSVTSGTTLRGQTDLQRARDRALQLLDQADGARGDRVALVAAASPARILIDPPTADLGAARRAIEAVVPKDSAPDWDAALAAAADIAARDEANSPTSVLLASTWRRGSLDPAQNPEGLLPNAVTLVATPPADEPAPSLAVTSFQPDRRVVLSDRDSVGGLGRVLVGLQRSGQDPLPEETTTVRVIEPTSGRPLGSLTVPWAQGERERTVPVPLSTNALDIPSGRVLLRASTDADALPADDVRFTAIEARPELRIGLLARRAQPETGVTGFRPADWVSVALGESEAGFVSRLIDPESVTRPRLADLDAALVLDPAALTPAGWDALAWFHQRGSFVLVAPSPRDESTAWSEGFATLAPFWTLPQEVSVAEPGVPLKLATDRDPLLDVLVGELPFLLTPVTASRWVAPRPTNPGEPLGRTLIATQSGEPWLVARTVERGTLLWLASSPDLAWTDLPTRPLFVPLMQELLRQGVAPDSSLTELVAGEPFPEAADRLRRWSPDTQPESLTLSETNDRAALSRGAWLTLDAQGRADGAVITHPDTNASDTTPTSTTRLNEWLARTGATVTPMEAGEGASDTGALASISPQRSLAFIVFAIVLALAAIETWLARRVSHVEGAA